MAQKVLLFADVGIDDVIAIIYSYLNNDIDLVGIVADYGNIPRENAIDNILYLRSLFQSEEAETTRIYAGAEIPMTAELPEFVPEIHGEFGLGPITPPTAGENGTFENFFEIIDVIEEYQDELVIVNIGRLTSLATMFILYGETMREVKEYYIMGGAFWVPGNVTAVSEANFHGDPVAAQIVLTYADNVTIIPMNVTERAIVTPEMVNYIDSTTGLPLIKTLLDYYYDFYKERDPNVQGSPMHDVLTIMAINREDMFTFYNLPVQIIQAVTGTERGQSIADIRAFGNLEEESETEIKRHRIAFQLDYPKFFKQFMTIMSGQLFE
ncbi:nucleoside hydrolase [Oceanobacillus bengalensis]|uniref:Nucleoside hydrolase n=1 Tax=Oceanobacillus bengalensis TaxID=1435466 RepID=A0A494Z6Z2_9BACI|nr:nucleoside hydrolase [Oceanobacillus bengalensis]RKQ18265.1 nucleoside hydrolase [Oceanobacillus bengalensis]